MKNITLAVDEDTLDAVRIFAAEQRTTVNGLVRSYLEQIVRSRRRAKEVMVELRQLSEKSEARLGPEYRFDRDSLYDR